MSTVELLRTLDEIECDMRRLETRLFHVRAALRKTIDPLQTRKDLGWFGDTTPLTAAGSASKER